jgi:hypothetical protein
VFIIGIGAGLIVLERDGRIEELDPAVFLKMHSVKPI